MTHTATNWSEIRRSSESLEVYLLGAVDFDSAHVLQRRFASDVAERSDRYGGMFVCEHPPVVTIGREASRDDLLIEPAELASLLIDVRRLNRGGRTLVHLPGQLAVCPVVSLERLGIGLAGYRTILQESLIACCRELRVSAWQSDSGTAVQCRSGTVAEVGVAVRDGVSTHGVYVNVSPDMDLIRSIQWSRPGERLTSLAAQRVQPTSMHTVRESLIRNISERLGYPDYHLYTGHPLLRRTGKTVHDYASNPV